MRFQNERKQRHKNVDMLFSAGADPGFQVGGGGALKKFAPSGGRRDNFWGVSCEKSRFYANKSYFFPWLRPCIAHDTCLDIHFSSYA